MEWKRLKNILKLDKLEFEKCTKMTFPNLGKQEMN